jgi:hypothetical protein
MLSTKKRSPAARSPETVQSRQHFEEFLIPLAYGMPHLLLRYLPCIGLVPNIGAEMGAAAPMLGDLPS